MVVVCALGVVGLGHVSAVSGQRVGFRDAGFLALRVGLGVWETGRVRAFCRGGDRGVCGNVSQDGDDVFLPMEADRAGAFSDASLGGAVVGMRDEACHAAMVVMRDRVVDPDADHVVGVGSRRVVCGGHRLQGHVWGRHHVFRVCVLVNGRAGGRRGGCGLRRGVFQADHGGMARRVQALAVGGCLPVLHGVFRGWAVFHAGGPLRQAGFRCVWRVQALALACQSRGVKFPELAHSDPGGG